MKDRGASRTAFKMVSPLPKQFDILPKLTQGVMKAGKLLLSQMLASALNKIGFIQSRSRLHMKQYSTTQKKSTSMAKTFSQILYPYQMKTIHRAFS